MAPEIALEQRSGRREYVFDDMVADASWPRSTSRRDASEGGGEKSASAQSNAA